MILLIRRKKKTAIAIASSFLLLFILSLFIDIGYFIALIFLIAAFVYLKKISETDEGADILNFEKNKARLQKQEERLVLLERIAEVKKKIAHNPKDFDATRELKDLEFRLTAMKERD